MSLEMGFFIDPLYTCKEVRVNREIRIPSGKSLTMNKYFRQTGITAKIDSGNIEAEVWMDPPVDNIRATIFDGREDTTGKEVDSSKPMKIYESQRLELRQSTALPRSYERGVILRVV